MIIIRAMTPRETLEEVLETVDEQYGFDYMNHYGHAPGRGRLSPPSILKREKDVDDYVDSLTSTFPNHPFLWKEGKLGYLVRAMNLGYVHPRILFCIDTEAWEKNNDLITEIGISIYDPTLQKSKNKGRRPYLQSIHVIIEEHEDLCNGKHVLDNKYNFTGGVSILMKKNIAIRYVQTLVHYYFRMLPEMFGIETVLVGQRLSGDINWFRKINVTFPEGVDLLDTQKIWATTMGMKNSSLSSMLDYMKMPHQYLHNAGNDAYYTLLLCLLLCDPDARLKNDLDELMMEDDMWWYRRLMVDLLPTSWRRGAQKPKELVVPTFNYSYGSVEKALVETFGKVRY